MQFLCLGIGGPLPGWASSWSPQCLRTGPAATTSSSSMLRSSLQPPPPPPAAACWGHPCCSPGVSPQTLRTHWVGGLLHSYGSLSLTTYNFAAAESLLFLMSIVTGLRVKGVYLRLSQQSNTASTTLKKENEGRIIKKAKKLHTAKQCEWLFVVGTDWKPCQ